MIFNVAGLVIGLIILGTGIYYLVKEKKDKEAQKIYGIAAGVGVVVTILFAVKTIMAAL